MLVMLWVGCAGCASALQIDDIKQQYLPEEYTTLLVGEQLVPAFPGQPTVSLSRGVALIFLDTGQRGLTLSNASSLAKKLNHAGWHTLVIPSLLSITETEQLQESDTDLVYAMHPRASASPRIINIETAQNETVLLAQAAFNKVNSISGFRLLITQGMQASLLTGLLADERIPPVDSIVLLNSFWPQPELINSVSEKMANSSTPTFDIAIAQQNSSLLKSLEIRQAAVNKALKMHYRQKRLSEMALVSNSQNTSDFTSVIYKEIQGWIRYLGW